MAIVQVATSPKNVSRANRAVVRTSGGVVYVATAEGPTSPTIRMWKGNTTSGGPTSFSEADSISDSNDNAGCAIAIDSNDVIHCFYNKTEVGMQGQPVVRYVTFATSTDTFGTAEDVANLDFDTAINFVGIAIDSNDKPHVVWKDGVTSMGNTTRHIYYSNKTGASWRSRVSVTSIVNTNAYGHGLDITIGPPGGTITADRPIIALNFFDQSTTRKLRGYYGNALDATSFTNNDDIGNGVDPNWTSVISMAFNSADRLEVSYTENSTNDWQTANHLESSDFSTGWSTGFIDTANDYIHTSLGDWGDIYRLCVSERSGNNDLYLYEDNGISTWTQNTDGDFPIAGDYEYPKLRWARHNHFQAGQMDVVFETNAGAIYYSYQAFVNNVVKILNETIDVWEIGRVPKPDVLYWQAENNANDSVGSRNGTFSAGTYATGKSGFGNCFNHAGATGADTVSIFDDNTPEMTSDSWTMNVWCNPDQYRIQGLILKDNAPGNTSFRVFMNSTSTNGVIEFDGEVSGTSEIGNITASGFKVGEWHMCTIVYDDATTTMKIYIDGKLSQSANVSATPLVNPDTAFQLAPSVGARWDGKTDEMAWWSYALDDDQIRNLYWSQDSGVLFQPLAVKSILPAINETMNILELVDEPPLFYYKGNNNIIPETAHTITTQAGSPAFATGKLKPTANGALVGNASWWGKVTPREDFNWDMRSKVFSLSCWVYIPTGIPAGNHGIFGPRPSSTAQKNWNFFYRETDLDLRFEIDDGAGGEWQINSSNLPKDTWLHCFITHDGTGANGYNLYIDNSLDNHQKVGTFPTADTSALLDVGINADNDGSQLNNSVRIQDLIFWETELTAEQRGRIYEEQNIGLLRYGDSVLRRQDEIRILNETERIVETNVFPPIAYYKFEDNTDDSIGPYDGTGFTGAYTASGPPNHGKAGVFDGNDSVDLGTELMDWGRTQPFSLAVWVKTTQGTGNFGWICKGTGIASQKGIYLFHNSTSPFINLFDVATSSEIRVKSSITTNDGNWHLVSVSYEGDSDANNIKFYVDGVLDTSPSIQINNLSGDITNTEETRIGANSTPGGYFIGDLSEAMVFDYALNDDQHVALWESSDGQPIFSARKFMGQTRLANETENITENIVDFLTTEGLVKIVNETLQISEGLVNPRTLARIVDETENITEGVVSVRGLVRLVAETVSITESIVRLQGQTRIVDENVNIAEGVLNIRGLVREIAETVNILQGPKALPVFGLPGNLIIEDFSTYTTQGEADTAWPTTDVNCRVDITDDRLEINSQADNSNDASAFNLGSAVDNTKFGLRFKVDPIDVTGGTNNNHAFFGLSSTNQTGNIPTSTNDFIGIHYNRVSGSDNWNLCYKDGAGGIVDLGVAFLPSEGTAFWIEIVRLSATQIRMRIFSDAYQTLVEERVADIPSSVQALQYVKASNWQFNNSVEAVIILGFDDIETFDGVLPGEVNTARTMSRIVDESVNILENIVKLLGRIRVVDETVQVQEGIVTSRTMARIIDETINIAENTLRILGLKKVVDETVNISEDEVNPLGRNKIVDETVNISEVENKTIGLNRVVDETQNITEQIAQVRGRIQILNETIDVQEAETVARALARITDETENITEDIVDVISGNLVEIVNETLNISENILSVRGLVREINETENITEQTNRVQGIIEIINETVNVLEGAIKSQPLVKIVNETENITEAINEARTLVKLINETLEVQEGELSVRGLVRLSNETVNVLEGIVRNSGLVKILNETVNILEQSQATIPFVKIIDETINILEGAIRAIGQVRILNESVEVLEYRIPPPIAYLPFDNNLNNKITNGPGFEMKTGSALYDAVNKKVGSHSFDFDSTSSIKASNETDFDFMDFDTPWSMSCWFRTPTPSQNQYLATKRAGPQNSVGFSWLVRGGSTQVAFEFDNGAGYEEIIIASLPALQANTWYHFVITYDGSSNRDGLMVWQNGIQARDPISSSPSSGSFQNNLDFVLGGQNATLDCDGQMDEFCVFDYELTAQQIAEMYVADDKADIIGSGIAQALRGTTQVKDETEQISEQANRARGVVREIAETIEIAEQVNYLRGIIRIHNEVLEIPEGIIRKSDLVRIINETVEINELALITLGLSRIIDETMNISENAEAIKGIAKAIDETVNITENIVEKLTLSLIVRVVDETVNITEGTLGRIGVVKLVNETINILENITSKRGRVGVVDETINITELIDRVIGQNKVVDETVNIQENTLSVRGLVRRIGETLQIDEAVNSARTMVRIVNEAINIEEGNIFSRGITRIVNEFVNIAELIKSHIPRVQGTTIDIKLVDNKIYDLELSPNSIIEVNLIDNEILDLEGIGEQ